jgi:signal transduction histidine kinase
VNIKAVSALLAALLIMAIGASVVLRNRHDKVYTSFAAFTFTVSLWHLCTFVAAATGNTIMSWLALWAAATIPPTAIAFYRVFLAQPSIGGRQRGPRVTLAWTFLAYAALIYGGIVYPIHETLWFELPFGAYVFGGLYRCVYDLYIQYRSTAKRVERARVRYLALGGFIATTLALTDVLPRFVAWPTIGNILGILYLYFLSQTLFRHRLIDVNELIGKMAVLGTLVVLLWAVYGFLLYWIGDGQKGLYLLNALVASFVILILFEPVRTRMENGINRWLLRQRHELRGRLELVRRDLPGVVDVPDMVSRIVTALEESQRATDGSVYLLDPDGAGFDRVGHFGKTPLERLDASSDRGFLDRARLGYIDTELLQRELEVLGATPENADMRAQLAAILARAGEMHADLVFPLLGSAETEQGPWLLGMLAVGDDRAGGTFDLDDIDTFRQLAGQAARVIESSQAYERVKERDRLAALGEMAAGLAHEIRNPLGAIKGAAQLLLGPDGKPIEPGGESSELMEIIVEEANRLNNVVTRFLDYARAEKVEREGQGRLDVNAIVRRTVQLLQQPEEHKNVDIRVRTDDALPQVSGDPEAFLQVFLNLGLNALQAMPDGGTLEILTTRRRRSRLGYGQFAEIRFRDTGVGIPRDKLKKLFIPFYTTKQKGTGLGLAISQRIVSQHGGTIEVRSNLGQGSTFSVFLPSTGEQKTTTSEIVMTRQDPSSARVRVIAETTPPGNFEAPAAAPSPVEAAPTGVAAESPTHVEGQAPDSDDRPRSASPEEQPVSGALPPTN